MLANWLFALHARLRGKIRIECGVELKGSPLLLGLKPLTVTALNVGLAPVAPEHESHAGLLTPHTQMGEMNEQAVAKKRGATGHKTI